MLSCSEYFKTFHDDWTIGQVGQVDFLNSVPGLDKISLRVDFHLDKLNLRLLVRMDMLVKILKFFTKIMIQILAPPGVKCNQWISLDKESFSWSWWVGGVGGMVGILVVTTVCFFMEIII